MTGSFRAWYQRQRRLVELCLMWWNKTSLMMYVMFHFYSRLLFYTGEEISGENSIPYAECKEETEILLGLLFSQGWLGDFFSGAPIHVIKVEPHFQFYSSRRETLHCSTKLLLKCRCFLGPLRAGQMTSCCDHISYLSATRDTWMED